MGQVARLADHRGTATAETVFRKQPVPRRDRICASVSRGICASGLNASNSAAQVCSIWVALSLPTTEHVGSHLRLLRELTGPRSYQVAETIRDSAVGHARERHSPLLLHRSGRSARSAGAALGHGDDEWPGGLDG